MARRFSLLSEDTAGQDAGQSTQEAVTAAQRHHNCQYIVNQKDLSHFLFSQ